MKLPWLVAAASFGGVAWIASRVRRGEMRGFDEAWAIRIGKSQVGARRICAIASPRAVTVEAVALSLAPQLRVRDRAAAVVSPLFIAASGMLLKRWLPRERPGPTRFTPEGGHSFPSTHTAHATTLALTLANALRARGFGRWIYLPALAVGALVGVERVRSADHWPSDVAAGLLLGVGSAATTRLLADQT